MNINFKVSVIIPVYNAEATIVDCVTSVMQQDYSDIEIILVNDGSIDRSVQLIKQINDPRIIFIDKKNGGVSNARNAGLEVAKGEYIIFIDSDDHIGKHFVSYYLEKIVTSPKSLIYQSFISCFHDKNVKELLPDKSFRGSKMLDALIILEQNRCLGGAWNKIFRTDIIHDNNIWFDQNFSYGEDKIFTLTYMQYIDEIILTSSAEYFYNRKNENTLSNKHHPSDELYIFAELEFNYFNLLLKKNPNIEFEKIVNSRYSSFLKYVLLSMYRKNDSSTLKDRKELSSKILRFDKTRLRNKEFENEVPKIINYVYRSHIVMKLLMTAKTGLPNLYKKFLNLKH